MINGPPEEPVILVDGRHLFKYDESSLTIGETNLIRESGTGRHVYSYQSMLN